jgi:hypothetical protein
MTPYHYAVLRYTHDVVTGEFLNVGVVIYCPDDPWLDFQFVTKIRRISDAFKGFDRQGFTAFIQKLKRALTEQGASLVTDSLFPARSLDALLNETLVRDDSSFQFSSVGFGLTNDPAKELSNLFDRFAVRYTHKVKRTSRSDEEIWSEFKRQLPNQDVLAKLRPVTLFGEDTKETFDFSWRNGQLNIAQPLSLDLLEPERIRNKALVWKALLGELQNDENFAVHFIVGLPSEESLLVEAKKAEHILSKAPNARLISETESVRFANRIMQEIEEHETNNREALSKI